MSHIPTNQPAPDPEIEKVLATFPDLVADAEKDWKVARLERERLEAMAYFRLKAEAASEKVTETWLQNKVRIDPVVHQAKLDEIVAEANYNRLYEKLMSAKKMASLRAAF